jgi:DNA-binding LacI/PurR family transcriptional regulator
MSNRYELKGKLAERTITQDDIAFAAGVHPTAVSRWFNDSGYLGETLANRVKATVEGIAAMDAAYVRENRTEVLTTDFTATAK